MKFYIRETWILMQTTTRYFLSYKNEIKNNYYSFLNVNFFNFLYYAQSSESNGLVGWLVGFYGISFFVGYLTPD